MFKGKVVNTILNLKELVNAYQEKNLLLRRGLIVISRKSNEKEIQDYAKAILQKEKNISIESTRDSE